MILTRIALGLSIATMLASTGCGGDDPLTGTWKNTGCFGVSATPAGIKSCTTELSFPTDLNFSLKAEQFSEPATATAPGCTTTRKVSGQTWSTDGDNVAIEGTGAATLARSSCVNATDEFAEAATTDISVGAGTAAYVITGDSLSIATGPLAGTYTR